MSPKQATNIYEPAKLIIEGCLTIGVNIFGLLANSLAINVLFKSRPTNLFNKTLFVLAVFDIIFNVCDTLEIIRSVYYDTQTCNFMPVYQKLHLYLTPQIIRPLRSLAIVASIYTTVVIALERYLAVSKPIITFVGRDEDTWQKLFIRIFPVIALSFSLSLPLCFEFFVDTQCFLCLDHHQVRDLPTEICIHKPKVQAINLKCKGDLISCRNSEIQSTMEAFTKSVNSVLGPSSEMNELDTDCYFRTIAVLQPREFSLYNKTYQILYKNIMLGILTYVVPLLCLFILNWLIYIHIRGRRKVIKDLGKNLN